VTIYELTQAIGRYKRFLLIGLGLLMALVFFMTFTFEDGGLTWRGGLKYESTFQISVVAPGTVSLSETETEANLSGSAAQYANLLTTGEAQLAIGEMSGYVLEEALNAGTARNSSIIGGSVIGPSPDLANAAAMNAFIWLAEKIQQPLEAVPTTTTTSTTPPPVPRVDLESAFSSTLAVEVDDSLAAVSPDLFVLVDDGQNQPAAVPVAQRAGDSVTAGATFEAGGSLLLNLEMSDGTRLDILRLAPDPLPKTAAAYPTLIIRLGPGALEEVENVNVEQAAIDAGEVSATTWIFNAEAVTTEWIEGTPVVQPVAQPEIAGPQQIQIAMLTEVPTARQIGGRRGPLLAFSVLMVGLILLLTSVIVADTWRRDREERKVTSLRISYDPSDDASRAYRQGETPQSGSSTVGSAYTDTTEPPQYEQ